MRRLGWDPARHGRGVLGALLIVAGLVLLVAQYARIDLGQYGWPLLVIVPGLGLLAAGLLIKGTSALLVPGAIVTATGLILALQNTFNLWATWAYAWALIFPGGAGLGLALQGKLRNSPRQVEAGMRGALSGLALFVVLGAFFEGSLHLSGLDLGVVGQVALPVALIVVGLALLATRIIPSRATGPQVESPAPAPPRVGPPPAAPPPPEPRPPEPSPASSGESGAPVSPGHR